MMGKHNFAPKLYYELSLERLVPQDHILRNIATAIDFSFVYPIARPYYSYTGQPSVDPIVLFKTLLIGYLYGITSERRLMREIQVNMAYRWFLGYDLDETIPDHSVLSKARSRFGMEVFENFFKHSIELCQEAGLLSEGPVYVDSTLIQAAASMDSLRERDESLTPPLSIREYVQRLYIENASPTKEEPVPYAPSPTNHGSDSKDRVPPRYRKIRPDGHRRKANNELVSRTDPEATVVSRRGFDMHLAYKAHVMVAGAKGRVITAALATTGAKPDEHLLKDMLIYHSKLTNLPVKEVVADAKYGTIANYEFLGKTGMTAYIPPRRSRRGPKGTWGSDRFSYRREQDVLVCPAGVLMKRFAHRASTQRVSYRITNGACKDCRFKGQCAPSQSRTISRFFDQNLVDEAKERLSSPRGQALLLQRRISAEGVFAWAKELHGLRRTRFMGRWKVQIQLWLTAAVINIKRAVKQLAIAKPTGSQKRINRNVIRGMLTHAIKGIAGVLYCRFYWSLEYFGNSPR